ncbi:MAG: ATP-binding protein, partial [Chloroflexota bacterium]|nr:ATP-binding protein [Chloroflexota bacterium]
MHRMDYKTGTLTKGSSAEAGDPSKVASDSYTQRMSEWFVAEPRSVSVARHAAENVRGVLGHRVCERISLLVSELAANAVMHGSRRSGDA